MTNTPHQGGYRAASDTTFGHIVAYGATRSESIAAFRRELEARIKEAQQ